MVYGICYKITSNTQTCQDCSINAFTNLFMSNATFQSIGKMAGYLSVSARNITINATKYSEYRRRHDADYSFTKEESEQLNDELDYLYIRALALIKEDMNASPIRSVQILKMLYFEEKTYAQIADILNVTPNTVSNLRAQGIIHLQKLINRETK